MTIPRLTTTETIAAAVVVAFVLMMLFPKRTAYAFGILVSVYRHVMQIKRDEPEVDPASTPGMPERRQVIRPSISNLGATISQPVDPPVKKPESAP